MSEYLIGWLPNLPNFNKFEGISESLVQSELNNFNNVIDNIKIKAVYESNQVWFLYLSNLKVKSLIDFDWLLYYLNYIDF